MEAKEHIAKTLKERRKMMKWSLDEASKRIGITKSHLWEIEQGNSKNPTIQTVESIANAFAITPASLCGWEADTHLTEKENKIIIALRDIDEKYK